MLLLHEFRVTGQNLFPVNYSLDAVTGNFLYIGDSGTVNLFSISGLNRKRNRMIGIVLCVCSQLQKLRVFHIDRMNFSDSK